jgi:succinate dehydrogenase/fumarate reductase flavoprotein subunit
VRAILSCIITTPSDAAIPTGVAVRDTTVDLLVIGAGTGMTAALAAKECGLSVLIVEKSSYVGGSTARSGGAL